MLRTALSGRVQTLAVIAATKLSYEAGVKVRKARTPHRRHCTTAVLRWF